MRPYQKFHNISAESSKVFSPLNHTNSSRKLDSDLLLNLQKDIFRFYNVIPRQNKLKYYHYRKNLLNLQGGVSTRSQEKRANEEYRQTQKRSNVASINLNPLLNKQLVAYDQSSGLAFVLIKKEMKRHFKFTIQDILYEYEISVQNRSLLTPALLELKLNEAIRNTILLIQKGYKKRENEYSQFFVIMKDHADVQKTSGSQLTYQQVHVYNSGHYYLFQDAQKTADDILVQISSYFQSNKEFELEKGFYLSFTVVHTMHETHRKSKNSYEAPKKVGGGSLIFNRYNLKSNRNFFLNMPPQFNEKKWCLPACLLYAKMRAHYNQYLYYCEKAQNDNSITQEFLDRLNNNIYKNCFLKINNLYGKNSIYCQKTFYVLVQDLLKKLNMASKSGFDYTTEGHTIADFLNVQYYIYSRIGNKKIYQYPVQRDISRPSVILYYEDYANEPIGHISLILKMTFFDHSYYCPYCNKRVLHNQALHYCHNVCKACRSYKRTEDNYFETFTTKQFCDQRDSVHFTFKQCPDCGVVCYSDTCYNTHIKGSSCKRGYLCHKCYTFVLKREFLSYETFLANHKCEELTCRLCNEHYIDGTEHLCHMKQLQLQSYYPNLAFFDTETYTDKSSIESCKECMLLEYSYLQKHNLMHISRKDILHLEKKDNITLRCPMHISNKASSRSYHNVNALSFYFEDKKRGNFSRVAFYDPALKMPDDCIIERNVLYNNYYLPNMKNKDLYLKKVRLKGQYARNNLPSIADSLEKTWQPLKKFLYFILDNKFRNYCIMSFNGQSFDMVMLLREAYELGLTPDIITRGQKIMAMTFKEYNIRFLDFMLYKSGSLSSLAKNENLPQQKIDFPFSFNLPENYEYIGEVPDNKYYNKAFETMDEQETRNKKLSDLREDGYIFNFKVELRKYVHSDVSILAQLATNFARECFEFQSICSNHYNVDLTKDCPYLHPYGDPFLTISSYVFGSWRYFCLPKLDSKLYIIPDEKGTKTINTSKQENEWIQWLQHSLFKDEYIESAYTSPKPPVIGHTRPDFYIKRKNIVGYFNGCVVHGHFDKDGKGCQLMKKSTRDDTNMFNEAYLHVNNRRKRHIKELKSHGISNIITIWECQWGDLKKKENLSEEAVTIKDFLNTYYKTRPQERLSAREALRGGKVEAYGTYFSNLDFPLKYLKHLDYNSLYPSVSTLLENGFPVGKPKTFINKHDIKHIKITENGAYYKNCKIDGVAHVKIQVKPTFYPFLQFKAHGKSFCAICSNCVLNQNTQPCSCDNEKKSFTGMWTLVELCQAVKNGDTILDIYEVLAYFDAKPILKDFLDILSSYKIRHSKFEETDQSKLKEICNKINNEMNFTDKKLMLTPETLSYNEQRRNFYKLCANSLLGKFSQSNEKLKYYILSTQDELNKLVGREDVELKEILPLGEIIQVGTQVKKTHTKPNQTSQVVVGAYVTGA